MDEHTHDAWIMSVHGIPDHAPPMLAQHDHGMTDVLVHDLDADRWYIMHGDDFADQYEWIT